ncbi:MAG TPA: PIN domain-containing protein [Chloroflexota bacterium]|nr:PIN domain-containing protein [Chloroflexota bacterium]
MRAEAISRVIGTLIVMFAGWQVGSLVGPAGASTRNGIIGLAVGAVVGFIISPLVVTWPYQALRRLVSRTPLVDLVFGVVGLVLGALVGVMLAYPLSFLPWWLGRFLPAAVTVACAYLGITLTLLRRREISHFLQARFGDRTAEPEAQNGRLLVDTSAIIDGRIADISQAGFLRGTLVVPRFVLTELQHIAGSSDPLRRNRGRRGLEILSRLQKDSPEGVDITDQDAREIPDVDGKLVKLACQMHCPVITNDFGLNRIAELQGVQVLNINQLANAVKAVVLPGEEMAVRIIQEGKEVNQGVGYLDDGTMIVVENGRRYLHNDIDIVVTRVLQTVAGRMIFAQPKSNGRE